MAQIDYDALNPTFAANYSSIATNLAANTVANTFNEKLSDQWTNAALAVGLLEGLQSVLGNGAVSGGEISAGSGLSVDIAAHVAFVGTIVGDDDVTVVGDLEPSSVNYIFKRQSGAFTVNQDGSDPPTTVHGDFLLWGTATTDGSGVTAVSNARAWIRFGVDDTGTDTASGGAAEVNNQRGTVTTEALTTAAGSAYTLTLTCNRVSAASQVFASVANGTNSQGRPVIGRITPGSGSVAIEVWNLHSADAFNGTLRIDFKVE